MVSLDRTEMLKRVEERTTDWDVIIVGGGATGLGIALDSVSRGYQTLLLERDDFTKGTSSRSTKLIHGGVRYLKQGNISLVFEALQERGKLRNNAPHLVRELPFVLPAKHIWGRWFYRIGLWLYDRLAGKRGFGPSKSLGLSQLKQKVSSLNTHRLSGGVMYYDGQTDDARLGLSLMKTAVKHGATILNYADVKDFIRDDQGRVTGVCFHDLIAKDHTTHTHQATGSVVINSTGVFIDQLRKAEKQTVDPMVMPSQGAHLVLPKRFLPGETAIIFPNTPDGRVLFAIPWYDRVIVGTTDVPREEIEVDPKPLEEELEFILDLAQTHLTPAPQRSDVLSIFAGLRPLVSPPKKKGVSTAQISREHTVMMGPEGVIHITGGKWTTYRKMAQDALDFAIKHERLHAQKCVTHQLQLVGSQPTTGVLDLKSVYGSEHTLIEDLIINHPEQEDLLHPELPYRLAEITFAARYEMAMTVEDVLSRRTRALLLDAQASLDAAPTVARILAQELGRDEEWERMQLEEYQRIAQRHLWISSHAE